MPTAINTARRLSCFGCTSFREGELSPVASPRRRARSLSEISFASNSVSSLKSVINLQTGWSSPNGSRCTTPSKEVSQFVDRFHRFQTLRCLSAQVDIFPAKADTSWLISWNFDALSVSDEEIFSHVLIMFDDLGLLSPSLVDPEALRNLLDLLALHYKDNP
ncbi:hypothetical protein CYMTET_39481 [Cymbomonas tetramitiformis]|nr:hypothetical protein CYMTET_39481 [Cymbomonas tetramitiformis]